MRECPVTPEAKRSRRTSYSHSCSVETLPKLSTDRADDGETNRSVSTIAAAALRDYKAASALTLRDYRGARSALAAGPVAAQDRPGSKARLTKYEIQGFPSCQVLTGVSSHVLVHSASDSIIQAWCQHKTRSASILVLLPRSHLLQWYVASNSWKKDDIPVCVKQRDRIPSADCALDEALGSPSAGVCFGVDMLDLLAKQSGSSLSTSSSRGSAGRPSRKSKRKRAADDDDSGNEAEAQDLTKERSWDLIIVDASGVDSAAALAETISAISGGLRTTKCSSWLALCESWQERGVQRAGG